MHHEAPAKESEDPRDPDRRADPAPSAEASIHGPPRGGKPVRSQEEAGPERQDDAEHAPEPRLALGPANDVLIRHQHLFTSRELPGVGGRGEPAARGLRSDPERQGAPFTHSSSQGDPARTGRCTERNAPGRDPDLEAKEVPRLHDVRGDALELDQLVQVGGPHGAARPREQRQHKGCQREQVEEERAGASHRVVPRMPTQKGNRN